MESLTEHIVSENDLDVRTAERITMQHNGDYVELAGPLVFGLETYAHNADYSIWTLVSDSVVTLAEGETYTVRLSEPVEPIDGAEYRDIYVTAEDPSRGLSPTVIGIAIIAVLGLVYIVKKRS